MKQQPTHADDLVVSDTSKPLQAAPDSNIIEEEKEGTHGNRGGVIAFKSRKKDAYMSPKASQKSRSDQIKLKENV